MSGVGRASVLTRFWRWGSGNIRDNRLRVGLLLGNNVGLASNNLVGSGLIGFGPATT